MEHSSADITSGGLDLRAEVDALLGSAEHQPRRRDPVAAIDDLQ